MPHRLTRDAVYAAARLAYEEDRLTAQHPLEGATGCLYEDDRGFRCPVGAALPDDVISTIRDSGCMGVTFDSLVGTVFDVSQEDAVLINSLQIAHDSWSQGVPFSEDRFRDLIYR